MVTFKGYSRFFRLVLLAALVLSPWLEQPALAHIDSVEKPLPAHTADASNDLLQFQSGGHVLGFAPDGMVVSNGTYALRVEFVDANEVMPQSAESNTSAEGTALQLTQVTYPDLWDGITLAYDAGGGLARSTYTVAPGADPAAIRLRYNAPVAVEADGSLRIDYETGVLHESAPVAWQEIDGARVPVAVRFTLFPGGEVSFRLGSYDPRYPLTIDPTLSWNTFLGGSGADISYSVAMDDSGGIYVAGRSTATWGSPLQAYGGGDSDVFVARLESDGSLIWHTFLGGDSRDDVGRAIAVDGSGNVYVTGASWATWGSPARPYTGDVDAFVAKLTDDGSLTWNTFLGGSGSDYGQSIAVDGDGNVYVTGDSNATWSCSPAACTVRPYTSDYDAFAASLGSDGSLTWNTFLGGTGIDYGKSITVDDGGTVYMAGYSTAAWGSPVRPYTSSYDAFAARLGSDGSLTWHTFLGGSMYDYGWNIVADGSGSVYVAGTSRNSWGSPIQANGSAFVARLDGSGSLLWNTFLGRTRSGDYGYGVAVDDSGSVFVVGASDLTWGSPVRPHSGSGLDGFAAQLGNDGKLLWNTFLGGKSSNDSSYAVAVDGSGNIYVVGKNETTWGSPLRAYSGGSDAFVAKLDPLTLTKSVSPASAWAGKPITYTITFGNVGPVTATDVVITDTLLANITEASYTSSGVVLTQVANSHYVWTAPDLAKNEGGIITITGVLTRLLATGIFTNTVTLSASGTVLTADAPLTVPNAPPVADAGGDQTVHVGVVVTLDGSASSDADDDTSLTYGWTQTRGTAVAFTPGVSVTLFTAPAFADELAFTLTVTDSQGLASAVADEIVVTVMNNAPVADAGDDQTVHAGTAVTLDGSASSDADDDLPLTYTWTQTGGMYVMITRGISVTTFTAPVMTGPVTFVLAVIDRYGLASMVEDEVVITVTNNPPVADAGGDQAVYAGTVVTLDGSASSDADGDLPLTYAWMQTGGVPTVTLNDAMAQNPTFTMPDEATVLTFTLAVADSYGATGTDEVVVRVKETQPKLSVIQTIWPVSARPGEAITYTIAFSNTGEVIATHAAVTDALSANITGASYTNSGVALTQVPGSRYVWIAPDLGQNEGGVITITGVLTKPLAAGIFTNTVTLVVSGTTVAADAPLTVQNVAPAADAGTDRAVAPDSAVILNGSGSDDNGDILTYAWVQNGGPTVALSGATTVTASFTAGLTIPTVYTFTLIVNDGEAEDTDTVTIAVACYTCYLPLVLKQ